MMKKRIILISIFILTLLFSACANNTSDTSKNAGAQPTEEKEVETEDSTQDTQENNKNTTDETNRENRGIGSGSVQATENPDLSKPISDINDGLYGTWMCQVNDDGREGRVVLALNSNNTFEFYQEETIDSKMNATLGKGTFKIDGDTLDFTFESSENNTLDLGFYPIFYDYDTFVYTLSENTLTLLDVANQAYTLSRV